MTVVDNILKSMVVVFLFSIALAMYNETQYNKKVYMYIEDAADIHKGKIELESKDWQQYVEKLDDMLNEGKISMYMLYQGDRVVHSKSMNHGIRN